VQQISRDTHHTSDHHYHHLEKSSIRNTIKFELVES
jgi:hypothetical protein